MSQMIILSQGMIDASDIKLKSKLKRRWGYHREFRPDRCCWRSPESQIGSSFLPLSLSLNTTESVCVCVCVVHDCAFLVCILCVFLCLRFRVYAVLEIGNGCVYYLCLCVCDRFFCLLEVCPVPAVGAWARPLPRPDAENRIQHDSSLVTVMTV